MELVDQLMEFVPGCPEPMHIVFFVVNIFLPGWGTMIGSILYDFDLVKFLIGLAQFLLCFLIIGWIWSIVWGWFIYSKGVKLNAGG